MRSMLLLVVFFSLMLGSGLAHAGQVNLSPDANGDRIGVINDGKVSYLPAKRVNIGAKHKYGGHASYLRRSKNGDLYAVGPALGARVFHSSDGGHTWTNWNINLNTRRMMTAFTILRDDTFVAVLLADDLKGCYYARSRDYGRTWTGGKMIADLSPYKYINHGNGDMLELPDGTLLLTLEMGMTYDATKDEDGKDLPLERKGLFLYAFRSHDGGKTWPEKNIITIYGAETHLLQLPSGTLLACIRKQRWHRLPGDPASVVELSQRYGWTREAGMGLFEAGENDNRIKNMFLSESYDGGYSWVNERQVTPIMKCSGDMTLLKDGTLVLQYLHRYGDRYTGEGIRAIVSYDEGKTWETEEYVIGVGGNYPGGISMPDGSMITICPNGGQVQAVHWRPKKSQETSP